MLFKLACFPQVPAGFHTNLKMLLSEVNLRHCIALTTWMLVSVSGLCAPACIRKNVCWDSLQLLTAMRGIKRDENINVFIFVPTNGYKPFLRVNNLSSAGFPLHSFYLFSGSLNLFCTKSITNHIAIKCKISPWKKSLHLPWFAPYKSMKMHDLFQQAIKFPKIVQQSLLYLELRRPAWLLDWKGFMSTATQWCKILLTAWDWGKFWVNTQKRHLKPVASECINTLWQMDRYQILQQTFTVWNKHRAYQNPT